MTKIHNKKLNRMNVMFKFVNHELLHVGGGTNNVLS